MGKESESKNLWAVEGRRWDFFGEKVPDFINNPLEIVENFIKKLPFGEELKQNIIELVRNEREKADKK